MKKFKILFIFTSSLFILTGCSNILNTPNDYVISEDIAIEIDENTLTNTNVFATIENNTDYELVYGLEVFIEQKSNNKWISLEAKRLMASGLVGFGLPAHNILPTNFDWESHYGPLEKGKYRIVKSFSTNGPESYVQSVAEFEITDEIIQKQKAEFSAIVNGKEQLLPIEILTLLYQRNLYPVKSAIALDVEPDVTIKYNETTYNIFNLGENGIIQFKENDSISQFELSKQELDLIINNTKH